MSEFQVLNGWTNKQAWLDAAEVFDAWRIVPRVLLFGYWIWVYHLMDWILRWYFALPSVERTLEASGLAGAVITAVTGLASWVTKVYMNSGRAWEQKAGEP